MRIFNDNLTKEFSSEDELNTYEAELASKKQKEEAERKVKEEKKDILVNQIKQSSENLHDLLKKYEEQEGHSFIFYDKDFNNINLTRLINGLVNGLWSF